MDPSRLFDLLKQDIPFEAFGRRGYLHVYQPGDPPTSYQVMIWDKGWYFHGLVLFQGGKFEVSDERLNELLPLFSELIVIWWS